MTNVWCIFIIISSCHYQTFDTLVIITQVQYFYKWIKIDVTSVFEVHYHEISVKTCKIHNQMQYFILYLNAKSWSDYIKRHIYERFFSFGSIFVHHVVQQHINHWTIMNASCARCVFVIKIMIEKNRDQETCNILWIFLRTMIFDILCFQIKGCKQV